MCNCRGENRKDCFCNVLRDFQNEEQEVKVFLKPLYVAVDRGISWSVEEQDASRNHFASGKGYAVANES